MPAAAAPSSICRSPPYHQVRVVTCVTSAPQREQREQREHEQPARACSRRAGTAAAGPARRGRTRRTTTRPRASARPGRRGRRRAPRGRAPRRACPGRGGSGGDLAGPARGSSPFVDVHRGELGGLGVAVGAISPRSMLDLVLGGLGLAGHRDVLPGGHREGAGGQTGQPGQRRPRRAAPPVPPATPAISAKLETRPSIAPKTAGRSQPPVTSACSWPISSARRGLRSLSLGHRRQASLGCAAVVAGQSASRCVATALGGLRSCRAVAEHRSSRPGCRRADDDEVASPHRRTPRSRSTR